MSISDIDKNKTSQTSNHQNQTQFQNQVIADREPFSDSLTATTPGNHGNNPRLNFTLDETGLKVGFHYPDGKPSKEEFDESVIKVKFNNGKSIQINGLDLKYTSKTNGLGEDVPDTIKIAAPKGATKIESVEIRNFQGKYETTHKNQQSRNYS